MSIIRRGGFALLAATAALLVAPVAHAIGDTIGTTNRADTNATLFAPWAQQFTVGPDPFTVRDLSIYVVINNGGGNRTLDASITDESNGLPGNSVITFTTVAAPPSGQTASVTFTPTGTFTLNANTNYWVTLTSGISNGAWWVGRPGIDVSTVGSVAASKQALNSGGWSATSFGANSRMSFQLNGTIQQGGGAVPEPGEWAFYGLAGVGLISLVVRRKMVKRAA